MAGTAARIAARPGRAGVRYSGAARGLTLVELLVTLAIAAILLAVGVPALQSFITNNQLATSANQLIAALNLARAEAVRCATQVGVDFTAGAGSNASWIVHGCPGAGGAPTTLRNDKLSDPQLTLAVSAPAAGNSLVFDSLGRLVGVAPGAPQYGLIVCRNGALAAGGVSTSRAVLVATTGRIKVAQTDPGTGVPMVTTTPPVDVTSCTAF